MGSMLPYIAYMDPMGYVSQDVGFLRCARIRLLPVIQARLGMAKCDTTWTDRRSM